MTYVPTPDEERKTGSGRAPMEIPDALVRQLQHSAATGARCSIDLDGTEDPDDIADLKRALIRAGYRLFADKTIYKRFGKDRIVYWVAEKNKHKGGKKV